MQLTLEYSNCFTGGHESLTPMPIIILPPIQPIHDPSLQTVMPPSSSGSTPCRYPPVRPPKATRGCTAMEWAGRVATGAHQKVVLKQSVDPFSVQGEPICCYNSLGCLGLDRSLCGWWHGLKSEVRRRHQATFWERGIVTDFQMAASKVAAPVLYKLDSIPNDMPANAAIASENMWPDVKRNDRLIVLGHRGCGKNNALSIGDVPGTRLSVRENTIRSFNLAANNGADFVEFDVQVTKDGYPVIFHDNLIQSEGQVSKIGDLTLEEFLAFGPQKDGKPGKSLVREQKDGTVQPWVASLEDSLCTLKDAFELVEPSIGFNIEVKCHDTEETPQHELKCIVSAVLTDVENYSRGHSIYFSSFHPDAAILLRQDQNSYSVFMLTEAGFDYTHADPRRNSVEAAIDVCLQNGLQGIVSEVLVILKKPELASQVKNTGLSLFTYGDVNNVAEALVQQYNLNVDGVIADCVREIVTASRTLDALLNFAQPDWSNFLQQGTTRDIIVK